jgi:hypothetical protein
MEIDARIADAGASTEILKIDEKESGRSLPPPPAAELAGSSANRAF